MDASFFIAGRLRFKGKIAMICIAVSFLIMIIAVAVASGYRYEIRSALSSVSGDVMITTPDQNVLNEERPIEACPAYLPHLYDLEVVDGISPVVYRAGIVRHDENMYGVLLKGSDKPVSSDSSALMVSIPSRLSEKTGLQIGDKMLTYFVGEKIKMRQFIVSAIHESLVETDDRYIVYSSLSDLQRLNGWDSDMVSSLEIDLRDDCSDEESIREATDEIGFVINAYSSDDEEYVIATSAVSRFSQLFGWLELIDFNVFVILLLMTVVAGFNMISGLLIMLFENISTIGLLKSLGMTDRAIAKVFLSSSAMLVAKGMIIGNVIALSFCVLQGTTHLLKLNPELYYVSFVPVSVNLGSLLMADLFAFVIIMLFLLLPCLFISKVDPSETIRVK